VVHPTALVTGVTGQDGVYLARHLLAKGRRVVGTVRPGTAATDPMTLYVDGVTVVEHDLRDTDGLRELLMRHRPAEVYNLASLSSVGASWGQPELVAEVNGYAVARALDALVAYRDATSVDVRFFQASSAEELGEAAASPYALAKAHAREAVLAARETHELFACAAILHNHESPLRGAGFVTRKITRAAAEIGLGRRDRLTLGNLEVTRDWGAASDYVCAMRLMLEIDEPTDLVIGTGVAHTLGQLLQTAFGAVGIDDPMRHVEQDPALIRPVDAAVLVADPAPAHAAIGWHATTGFEALVRERVEVDVRRVESEIEESPDYVQSVR
jgi:GDPmannose 4,6-dehydratase